MDKLQLPHAKLLYFVSELWKTKEIDETEKKILKEKIISDEPSIFEQLDNYEVNGCLDNFKLGLLNLIRQKEQPDDKHNQQDDDHNDLYDNNSEINDMIIPGVYKQEGNTPDELSSPLGMALLNHKKKNQSTVNHLKDVLRPIEQN